MSIGNAHPKTFAKVMNEGIEGERTQGSLFLDNTTWVNYTTQFLGMQYFLDLSIIEYVTNTNPNIASVSSIHRR